MLPYGCVKQLVSLLGARACLDRPEDLALYEYDGGVDKHLPDVVVFPRTTAEVAGIVKIAREFKVPLVGRGAGTGLSGGAIAREGGIVVAFARMNADQARAPDASCGLPCDPAPVPPGSTQRKGAAIWLHLRRRC